MNKFTFTLAAALFSSLCFSQEIKVRESNESFSTGSHNALLVTIYVKDKALVEKEWKSLVKNFNPDHTNEKGGEYFFDNATFKPIGNNTIDVYSRVKESKDGGVELMAAYDLGGAYLSSSDHKDKFEYFKKMMYDFAVKTTKDILQDEWKAASKDLNRTLDKEKDLEKDNKNLENDIKNYNDKITKAKSDIENNKKEIEVKKKEAETQQKVVDALKLKMDGIK
ncbi:MAG: hypothetical protein ACJ76F_05310 [Bacteroidia bacterium]